MSHKMPLASFWSGRGRVVLLITCLLAITRFSTHTQEDRYLLRMMRANKFLLSPRLTAQLFRHTERRLSVLTIAVLQDIILAGQTDAPNWLKCIVGAAVSVWEPDTGDTVSSLTSQDSSCITQMDELQCVGGRVRGTFNWCVCREQIVISFYLSLYGLDFTMVVKVSWLC